MSAWLSKGKRKSTDDVKDLSKDEGVSAEKKVKTEESEEAPEIKQEMDSQWKIKSENMNCENW